MSFFIAAVIVFAAVQDIYLINLSEKLRDKAQNIAIEIKKGDMKKANEGVESFEETLKSSNIYFLYPHDKIDILLSFAEYIKSSVISEDKNSAYLYAGQLEKYCSDIKEETKTKANNIF